MWCYNVNIKRRENKEEGKHVKETTWKRQIWRSEGDEKE